MLLPFCTNGIGPFQNKPWSPYFGMAPISTPGSSAFQPPISLAPFRAISGPCVPTLVPPFHNITIHQAFPRPPIFPILHSPPTVRPVDPMQSPKISKYSKISTQKSINLSPNEDGHSSKKKIKIFRPWDDRSDIDLSKSDYSPNAGSSISSAPSSIPQEIDKSINKSESKIEKSSQEISPKLKSDPTPVDDVEQSKSAFEVFATNLGKSPDGHRCIYCGKMYSRKYGLKIHLRTHTGFKPLKCKVCQRPFGDPSNLNKHVRLHADVLLLSSSTVSTTTNSEISFCQKRSNHHEQLTNEIPSIDSIHQHQQHYQLSIFKCPFCGRSLVRKRDLERHLASRHPNEQLIDVERL